MSETVKLYENPSAMEPLLPEDRGGELSGLALELVKKAAGLAKVLHPITRRVAADLLRRMNCYYSNQIEGQTTHPIEIERALKKDFSSESSKAGLQKMSYAHVRIQREMEERLRTEKGLDIFGEEFLCWLHGEFYSRLPKSMRRIKNKETGKEYEVVPGELRKDVVHVGEHFPPKASELPRFLKRFSDAYRGSGVSLKAVVAAAASHHRLAWIHPFLDGNGRVTRLFTHAYLIRAEIDGAGLWTISRGFARRKEAYYRALRGGDVPRRGDLDGRGNLSEEGLSRFCRFFLETAIDQVEFMAGRLEVDELVERVKGYVELMHSRGKLRREAVHVLRTAILQGEVQRGELAHITGKSRPLAGRITAELVRRGLLTETTERGPLRAAFPASAAAFYFPKLYPDSVEAESLDRERAADSDP